MNAIDWTGIDRKGIPRGGHTEVPPAQLPEFVEKLHNDGFRQFTARRGMEVVARISPAGEGRRTWWAESV